MYRSGERGCVCRHGVLVPLTRRLRSLLPLLLLLSSCSSRGCEGVAEAWRRPIRRLQLGLSFDFTSTTPSGVSSVRASGDDVYVGDGAGVVTKISSLSQFISEDLGDGRGRGIWVLPGFTNELCAPFDMSSGSGAGGNCSGWGHTGLPSKFLWDGTTSHHTARMIDSSTVSVVASPWTNFVNALDCDSTPNTTGFRVSGAIGRATSTFTLELKTKPQSTVVALLAGKFGSGAASRQNLWVQTVAGPKFACAVTDGGAAIKTATTTTVIATNTLYDIACVFDDTADTLKIFLNGTAEATTAVTSLTTPTAGDPPFTICNGSDASNTIAYDGVIDELRFSNIARYSGNYTPATTPFTTDANTTLLFNMDAAPAAYTGSLSGSPDGTSRSQRFVATEIPITTDSASRNNFDFNVSTANSLVSSAWTIADPDYTPSVTGLLSPQAGTSLGCTRANPSSTSVYSRVVSPFFKSGATVDSWQGRFAGATVVTPPTNAPGTCAAPTVDTSATGGARYFGAQIASVLAAEIPLIATSGGVGGTTVLTVVSLDSSNLSRVLQTDGSLYMSATFLEDPFTNDNGNVFAFVNGDGTTSIELSAPQSAEGFVNSVSLGLNSGYGNAVNWYYGVPTVETWRLFVGSSKRVEHIVQGCRIGIQNTAGATSLNAPTAVYLGSNGSSNVLPRRFTNWSFNRFDSTQTEGLVFGDSIMSSFSVTHIAVCSWIYTQAQAVSRTGIISYAIIGNTINQQKTVLDTNYPTPDARVQWAWLQMGVNDLNTGDTVAQATADYQAFVDDAITKFPSATLFLAPITPCAPTGCTWANVLLLNANIAGTGGTPVTCVGGTCVRVPTWDTAALLGDGSGTGVMNPAYNSGDDLHENDLGGKVIGLQQRAQLVANGKL